MPCWAHAYGAPAISGQLRSVPEDFVVDEDLGFEPDGHGDHLLLHIRKRETNTEWLARELARHAGIKPVDVGFAGLKDRHAVTTQWFSLHLPEQQSVDWSGLSLAGVEILAMQRHRHKLRRGELRGNHFRLRLRALDGDIESLPARLQRVATQGVPNYFGEQRFGINGGNLAEAERMFAERNKVHDRHKRGLYLSAARSFLFNTVLSARVEGGTWLQSLPGEVVILRDSDSSLTCEQISDAVRQRITQGDLLTTGPLWGRGRALSSGEVLPLEQAALEPYAQLRDGLEHAGLRQERRALVLRANNLEWRIDASVRTLELSFWLPAGAYATTLLREVVATAEG